MNRYLKIMSTLLSAMCILTLTACTGNSSKNVTSTSSEEGLNVHMIDVGQGDSILLEYNSEYMLIDAGEISEGEAVVDYLKGHNVDKLNYAVITHPHSDHYGGMQTVLESVDTENIIMSEAYNTTRTWESLVDYIDENKYNVISPVTNDVFKLGDCEVTAFVPQIDNDDLNNCSIILRAEYEGVSALFTGDAEKSEEKQIIESGFDVSADVLKVGHHGSSTSTSDNFFDKVSPNLALISCGKDNDYGHPHRETIAKFNENNITIFRTDEYGSITVNINNGKADVITNDGSQIGLDFYAESANNSSIDNQTNDSNNLDTVENTSQSEATYVGNKNSQVFHLADCSSAEKMAEKNKVYFNSRDDAVKEGYTPCKSCNP